MSETKRGASGGPEQARARRLADALRDNLRRRKQQGREISEPSPSTKSANSPPGKEHPHG